jgi:hypothetical protein
VYPLVEGTRAVPMESSSSLVIWSAIWLEIELIFPRQHKSDYSCHSGMTESTSSAIAG